MTGFKTIRKGVYEPLGYRVPQEPVDRDRVNAIVGRILSTNTEPEEDPKSEAVERRSGKVEE